VDRECVGDVAVAAAAQVRGLNERRQSGVQAREESVIAAAAIRRLRPASGTGKIWFS